VKEIEARLDQLLGELAREGVRFCVVGSFALAVHGAPRGSIDVGAVPDTSEENLARLASALEKMGATLEPGGPSTKLTPRELSAPGELKLYTDRGIIHLLTSVEGVPGYSELAPNGIEVEVDGEPVMFCSRADLVELKRRSGRLIDRADLERLAEADEAEPG